MPVLHCKLAVWIFDFDFALQNGLFGILHYRFDNIKRKLHYALTFWIKKSDSDSEFEFLILTSP